MVPQGAPAAPGRCWDVLVLPSPAGLRDAECCLGKAPQCSAREIGPGARRGWSLEPSATPAGWVPSLDLPWAPAHTLCWDVAAKPELPRCLQHCSVPSPPELAQLPSGILAECTALCVCAAPSTTRASPGWAGGAAVLSLGTSSRAVPQQGDHSLTRVSCPGPSCVGGLSGCVVTQGAGCQRWEGHRLCSQS